MEDQVDTQLAAAREQLAYRGTQVTVSTWPGPSSTPRTSLASPERSQAAAALEEAGYRTELARWRVFGASLEATRPSTLDEATVEAFVHEVRHIVVAHNGDYDGWGGEVVLDPTGDVLDEG